MSNQLVKLRIAICGGGIGGLTLAAALSRCPDIRVDVYEAASKFTEIGAGIGLWWRTRTVLKSLGLEDDVLQLLDARPTDQRAPTIHYRRSDQPDGISFATMEARGGLLGVHRAEFHEVLLRRLPPRCRTYTSKRLSYYIQRAQSSVQLVFEDGSTAICDVLIGADGVKSVVRSTMMEEFAVLAQRNRQTAEAAEIRDCILPRWSGVLVYRALIPAEKLARVFPQHRLFSGAHQFLGKNKHIMAYPVLKGRYINFAAFEFDLHSEGSFYADPWVSEVDPRSVIRLFQGWEQDTRYLVECLDGLKVTRWAVNVVKQLPSYVSNNVALLGDAAHAMTPFQGAGAGQAIEDGFILSALLSHRLTTRHNVRHALRIYSRIRQPQATRVADRSRQNGMHFSLHGLSSDSNVDHLSHLRELGEKIQDNFEWVSETDPIADLRKAVELLESAVGGGHAAL